MTETNSAVDDQVVLGLNKDHVGLQIPLLWLSGGINCGGYIALSAFHENALSLKPLLTGSLDQHNYI